MATATTKAATSTEMPEFAQKLREQLMLAVQQGQQMSVEAAETWVKAVSALPVPDLPSIPGLPSVPGVEAAMQFSFEIAADLLNAQRQFTLQMAKVLVPVKAA